METRNADNATAAAPPPPKRPFISCCRLVRRGEKWRGVGRWPNEVKSTSSSDAAEEREAAAASSSLSCSWMRDGRFTKVVNSL